MGLWSIQAIYIDGSSASAWPPLFAAGNRTYTAPTGGATIVQGKAATVLGPTLARPQYALLAGRVDATGGASLVLLTTEVRVRVRVRVRVGVR